jgi:hypothetical protein
MSEPATEQEQQQEQDGPEPEPTPAEQTEEEEAAEQEESEQVEGVPAEEEQPEQPSGAAGAVGEKELEKMFAKVERANVAYVKRIGESMGEEFGVLEQCPRCASPFLGFIFPPMMRPATDEVKAKVLASIGEHAAMATQKANFARRCDDCDGNGVVLSGSRRNDQKTIRCRACEGKGFVYVGEPPPPVVGYTEVPVPSAEVNGVKEDAPSVDLWGRPAGHPDYGVHPMYAGAAQ